MVDAVSSGRYFVFTRSGSLLLCGCLLGVPVLAQTMPSPSVSTSQSAAEKSEVDRLVDQLRENLAVLCRTLPSITAHKRVETHATRGIIWQNSTSEGNVRVMRATGGGALDETNQMTVFNGKPLAPGVQKGPFQPSAAFIHLQFLFFRHLDRACLSFTMVPQSSASAPIELYVALSPEFDSLPNCKRQLSLSDQGDPTGLTGIVRVDPATHQATHIERTMPASGGNNEPFFSTDYAPVKIGEKTFWLPTETDSLAIMNKAKVHTIVHYSDYHLFTASSTILPGTPEADAPQAPTQ